MKKKLYEIEQADQIKQIPILVVCVVIFMLMNTIRYNDENIIRSNLNLEFQLFAAKEQQR